MRKRREIWLSLGFDEVNSVKVRVVERAVVAVTVERVL